MMSSISTITEFLESTGIQLFPFDIGRRISPLGRDSFLRFEKTEEAYPFPLQRQAWFALVCHREQIGIEPFIWFLRFPLDEQGKLLQATRDDFMHRLMDRLGEKLQESDEQQQQSMDNALKDNPYTFKPREERMALFHAQVSRLLKKPPSDFYSHAQEYFAGELGWEQWAFVGYQGIADIAVRFAEGENAKLLNRAIDEAPLQPLEALCHCLESESIPTLLAQALIARTSNELENESPDPALLTATVRGISNATDPVLRDQLITSVLKHPCSANIEILAAVSGRAWEALKSQEVATLYLERLAENDSGQEAFSHSLVDLLFLPEMRDSLLQAMRNPQRSGNLSTAIGNFFQSVNG
ncbi:MAG: DUF3549 family protein [Candidatus Sedimenticola sp. (ex Thyasira tokunagai)]